MITLWNISSIVSSVFGFHDRYTQKVHSTERTPINILDAVTQVPWLLRDGTGFSDDISLSGYTQLLQIEIDDILRQSIPAAVRHRLVQASTELKDVSEISLTGSGLLAGALHFAQMILLCQAPDQVALLNEVSVQLATRSSAYNVLPDSRGAVHIYDFQWLFDEHLPYLRHIFGSMKVAISAFIEFIVVVNIESVSSETRNVFIGKFEKFFSLASHAVKSGTFTGAEEVQFLRRGSLGPLRLFAKKILSPPPTCFIDGIHPDVTRGM
jgi:hypothetical protein